MRLSHSRQCRMYNLTKIICCTEPTVENDGDTVHQGENRRKRAHHRNEDQRAQSAPRAEGEGPGESTKFPALQWLRRNVLKGCRGKHEFVVLKTSLASECIQDTSDRPGNLGGAYISAGLFAFDNDNYKLAIDHYLKAASCGELIGLHNLGVMMLYGQGVSKDFKRAYECFILCSSYGVSASMAQVGYMYMHARGLPQSHDRARKWFLRAHKVGNEPYAQFYLAVIHLRGLDVPINKTLGRKWLSKSALNGYPPAIFNLALMYEKDDNTKAVGLYRHAAVRQGHDLSQNNLGVLYADGLLSLKKDLQHAYELFRMAAVQGSPDGLYNLGEAYSKGIGVKRDVIKGAKYYYCAAQYDSNGNAAFKLGNLFWHGYGHHIHPSESIALFWFGQAVNKGHQGARHNYFVVKQSMDSQNLSLRGLGKHKLDSRYVYY